MIELGEEAEYEVQLCAVIGVHRTVRVKARGTSHARMVAKDAARDETTPHVWTFPETGETVTVGNEHIVEYKTGMCPTKVES